MVGGKVEDYPPSIESPISNEKDHLRGGFLSFSGRYDAGGMDQRDGNDTPPQVRKLACDLAADSAACTADQRRLSFCAASFHTHAAPLSNRLRLCSGELRSCRCNDRQSRPASTAML